MIDMREEIFDYLRDNLAIYISGERINDYGGEVKGIEIKVSIELRDRHGNNVKICEAKDLIFD